jgi:hypothetical protein
MSINRVRTARRPPPVLADVTNTSAASGAGIASSTAARGAAVEDLNSCENLSKEEEDDNQENVCPLEDLRRVRFNSGNNREKFLSPALSSGQVRNIQYYSPKFININIKIPASCFSYDSNQVRYFLAYLIVYRKLLKKCNAKFLRTSSQ